MAIDWKTILSEFDGKPTLLQAIGKLRKAVEEETITIQQAQAEIAKLESQQKADEALINTKQDKLNDKSDVTVLYLTATNGINAGTVKAREMSDSEDNVYNFPKKAGTFALTEDVTAVGTKAQNALDLAKTNEKDIGTLDGQVAEIENVFSFDGNDKELSIEELKSIIGNSKTSKTFKIIFDTTDNYVYRYIWYNGGQYYFIGFSQKKSVSSVDQDAIQYRFISVFQNSATTGKISTFDKTTHSITTFDSFKTLFGNQSIVGTGNIDLYKHHIVLTSNGEKGFFDFYSSKNTNCDSLTDLKTLLGNTFEVEVCGQYSFKDSGDNDRFYRYAYITETSIFVEKVHTTQSGDLDNNYPTIGTDSNVTWSSVTITDTVTTI